MPRLRAGATIKSRRAGVDMKGQSIWLSCRQSKCMPQLIPLVDVSSADSWHLTYLPPSVARRGFWQVILSVLGSDPRARSHMTSGTCGTRRNDLEATSPLEERAATISAAW